MSLPIHFSPLATVRCSANSSSWFSDSFKINFEVSLTLKSQSDCFAKRNRVLTEQDRIHLVLIILNVHVLGVCVCVCPTTFAKGNYASTPVFLPGVSSWTGEPGGLQSMGSQRVRHN